MSYTETLGDLQFQFGNIEDTAPVYAPKIGDHVMPDGWQTGSSRSIGENLIAGDSFSPFRLPTGFEAPLCESLAVNIKVTGHKAHNVRWHRWKVRVEIE